MKNLEMNKSFQHPDLHPRKQFNTKQNLDRFGFSFVLRNYCGLKQRRRSFCSWMHGVPWWDEDLDIADLIGPFDFNNKLNIVVINEIQKSLCHEHGYKNVFASGAPILYTPTIEIKRNPNVLVAFIAHSAEQESKDVTDKLYLDFLESQLNDFEEIYVSVFSLDIHPTLINEINKRNLKIYQGADPRDRYSLERMQALLKYAGYVSSNCMGGSVAYAMHFGCQVSLFEDIFESDQSRKLKSGWSLDDVSRIEYVHSKKYLIEKFPYLFVPIKESKKNISLGNEICGSKFKMSPEQSLIAAGWDLSNQLEGYYSGFRNRLKGLINFQ